MRIEAGSKGKSVEANRISNSVSVDYVIYPYGNYYYVEACSEGYSDHTTETNKDTAAQWAINALSSGGLIATKGFIIDASAITLTSNVTILEHYAGRTRKLFKQQYPYTIGVDGAILPNRPSIPAWCYTGKGGAPILQNGYLCLPGRKNLTEGAQAYFPVTFTYGTYQWQGKVSIEPTDWDVYLGLGEQYPKGFTESIFLWWDGSDSKWYFETYAASSSTKTDVTSAATYTDANTFKVEWSAGLAKLYVNTVLKATHNTDVPTARLIGFSEYITGSAQASDVLVFTKDYKKIV